MIFTRRRAAPAIRDRAAGARSCACGDHEKELSGGEPHTTNNRMELMAAIAALEALKRPCQVDLHTDSKYVQQRHHRTDPRLEAHGWKTADKKPVKNIDLWQRLEAAVARHRVAGAGSKATPATS